MNSLKNTNLKNKTILLRADINSPIIKGKVLMNERIKQSAQTIKYLKSKKAKVIILAHQSQPGKIDFISLEQHTKLLNKLTKVKFVKDIIGKKAKKEIKNLKDGQAILLNNIRFIKDEYNPGKNSIVKFFLPLIDYYVNDAFSVSHRNQTSIVSFPKYFSSFPGPNLEKELNALKKIHLKETLYILGGAKSEDNIKILKKTKKILATGIFALYCLNIKGYKLGKQEKTLIKNKNLKIINSEIKKHIKKIITPIDLAINVNGKRNEIPISQLPTDYLIPDIGTKTIKLYSQEIKKAKSIFMKGPAGNTDLKSFSKGTNELLKAISKSKAFSLLGGGHLNEAIDENKISKKKFNHISLSGGALISYVAGKKLPGIEALKKSR